MDKLEGRRLAVDVQETLEGLFSCGSWDVMAVSGDQDRGRDLRGFEHMFTKCMTGLPGLSFPPEKTALRM